MSMHFYCDGIKRRDFIRVGALSASSFTLANYLRMTEAGQVRDGHATSGIFIDLSGGPSHLDTFDPKPDAPEGIRGDFKTIPTNVPGVYISEQLPKMTKCFDKYVILRCVSHTLAAHRLGSEYVNTDNHTDIFNNLKTKLLPKLDGGVSALLTGLEQKGLLSSTAVMVTGEFGRTPKINTRATLGGRDHYPRCMFMLMAGGKVRGGQVSVKAMKPLLGPPTMPSHRVT